jgi:putative transposase
VSAFIEQHRERFGVEPICEILGVSASASYERATGRHSARAVEDERLLTKIEVLHEANYLAYGSRRMWKALLRAGEQVGRDRVARLMREHGMQAPSAAAGRGGPPRPTRALIARRISSSDSSSPPAPINCGSLTSPTYAAGRALSSSASWIDAYSRRIVGWQFAAHMRTTLVLDALAMALHQRSPGADVTLVHHSDAGSQYTSIDYTQTLNDAERR